MPSGSASPAVLIAGAGAAGLMAALAAAGAGASVTVVEQLPQAGRKLCATGGGRCNLTNTLGRDELIRAFGPAARFVRPALASFDSPALCGFFARLGLPAHAPDGFHLFPVSEKAAEVEEKLRNACLRAGVRFRFNIQATGLILADGEVRGIRTGSGEFAAACIILATGGRSYPSLGGTGGGYALAQEAGHGIVTPVPALAGLTTREEWPKRLAGIVLPESRLRLRTAKGREETEGELLFTHDGLSGPAALDLSGRVAEKLARGEEAAAELSVLAKRKTADWLSLFVAWAEEEPRKQIGTLLARELPKALAAVLAGAYAETRAGEFPSQARHALAAHLTAEPLSFTGTAGWEKAMLTRGGVERPEVDPKRLMSRRTDRLFFAGELLDVDGPCGGYNLHWAFASGRLAGEHAAREALRLPT